MDLANTMVVALLLVCFFYTGKAVHHDGEVFPHQLWTKEEMVELAGYGERRLSNVLVTGSLDCISCPRRAYRPYSFPISGAAIGVKCDVKGRQELTARGVSDEYGEFLVHLPSELHAIPHLHKHCSLHVLSLPWRSNCRPSNHNVNAKSSLELSSIGDGIRTYSAGSIRLPHLSLSSSRACINKLHTA